VTQVMSSSQTSNVNCHHYGRPAALTEQLLVVTGVEQQSASTAQPDAGQNCQQY